MSSKKRAAPKSHKEKQAKQSKTNPISRTEKLEQLRKMSEQWKHHESTDLFAPKAQSKAEANLPPALEDIVAHISMSKRRNGEYLPVVHAVNSNKQVPFLLPPMQVVDSRLSKDGNLGDFGNNNPDKARYTVSLEADCDSKVRKLFPGLAKRQKEVVDKVPQVCHDLMAAAYYHDESNSWDEARGDLELDEFVEKSNKSCLKTVIDDDEPVKTISLTRRFTDFRGGSNAPVFWKVNREGHLEQIEPKDIAKGALVQCVASFRAYNVNAEMYGVSLDLGKDIIVCYVPPKEEPHTAKVDVPFIEFDC